MGLRRRSSPQWTTSIELSPTTLRTCRHLRDGDESCSANKHLRSSETAWWRLSADALDRNFKVAASSAAQQFRCQRPGQGPLPPQRFLVQPGHCCTCRGERPFDPQRNIANQAFIDVYLAVCK